MPHYLDVHHRIDGLTGRAVQDAHRKDLEVQGKYGVKYLRYCCCARAASSRWCSSSKTCLPRGVAYRQRAASARVRPGLDQQGRRALDAPAGNLRRVGPHDQVRLDDVVRREDDVDRGVEDLGPALEVVLELPLEPCRHPLVEGARRRRRVGVSVQDLPAVAVRGDAHVVRVVEPRLESAGHGRRRRPGATPRRSARTGPARARAPRGRASCRGAGPSRPGWS